MTLDLSAGGMALPLLIAAAVGLGLWAVLGGKKADPPAGGLAAWLPAGNWPALAGLVLTAWTNRAAVVDVVAAAWAKLKPILYPPARADAPAVEPPKE